MLPPPAMPHRTRDELLQPLAQLRPDAVGEDVGGLAQQRRDVSTSPSGWPNGATPPPESSPERVADTRAHVVTCATTSSSTAQSR